MGLTGMMVIPLRIIISARIPTVCLQIILSAYTPVLKEICGSALLQAQCDMILERTGLSGLIQPGKRKWILEKH